MKTKTLLCLTLGLAAAGSVMPGMAAQPAASVAQATSATAEAARKFLATLDDGQRAKVVFAFDDAAQRKRWSNFPTGIFQRAGLRLGELTAPQREAALALLAAALSPQGYEKVMQIVEADEVLKNAESGGRGGAPAPSGPAETGGAGRGKGGKGGKGGGGLLFGRDLYYLSLLGQPSATDPWIIQFGGHHLGINITLVGDRGTVAPSHTGAQPAIYEIAGKTIRPLGREVDKAAALMGSLDDAQRKQAILSFQVRDLVLGPGRDGQTIQPEGLKATALNAAQQEMLLDIAAEWTGLMSESTAQAKREEMKKNIAETWFAWSGPTEPGKAAYFRIQGPTVLIEFSPQSMGGDATKHIHTIYRDPTNDYGVKWTKP